MERIVVTLVAVVLLILDANNYVKVPEQAITLVTGLYIAGDSVVRSAKIAAISKVMNSDVNPMSITNTSNDDRVRTIRKL